MTPARWVLGEAPADDPLSYPGTPPPGDVLLAGRELLPLRPVLGTTGLGDWLAGADLAARRLDDMLADLGAWPMGDRHPVLAVGSNRNPAQLARKLADPDVPWLGVLPVTAVRVSGIGSGFSAHVGRWGYLPIAPVSRPGVSDHWMTWLDADQLAVINATEPNYLPEPGLPGMVRLAADHTVQFTQWSYYRSKWGALQLPPDQAPTDPVPQQLAWRRLLRLPWFADLTGSTRYRPIPELVAQLRDDEGLRAQVQRGFADNGLTVPDGLDQ